MQENQAVLTGVNFSRNDVYTAAVGTSDSRLYAWYVPSGWMEGGWGKLRGGHAGSKSPKTVPPRQMP